MNSSSTELFLSRMHWPVTTLGYGRRIGIWFQGCSIGCKGCCSRDTWTATPAHSSSVEAVLAWIAHQPLHEVDGFTISGGEPTEQPQALAALLTALRHLPDRADQRPRDLLLYSGLPWARLERAHAQNLALADAVISEPFVASRPDGWLAGSDNQITHPMTHLGRQRYGAEATQHPPAQSLQLHHEGHQLWLIGIPKRGDLERLQQEALSKGIVLGANSWIA